MDVFQKCFDFKEAEYVRGLGLYPYFRMIASGQDPVVTMNGSSVIMLGSNNYLGLTNHPEIKAAAAAALAAYGTGTAGSRFLNGTLDIHVELEERLAAFMKREAALTFSTGFQVNLGVISSLIDRTDTVVLDNLDHACILDGARLSFGRVLKFKHNDMASLEERLRSIDSGRGSLIVIDGVFSMEGDVADLPGIVELAKRHHARVMVDDAHGVGVMGEHGRGTAEHFGLEDDVDLVMGTFSKSLAAVGGFVAGDRPVVEWIKHHARTLIFSAAPPPASVASVIKALEIIEREPERRAHLWDITRYMKRELEGLGYDTGASASPVIPLVVGEDMTAFRMTVRLQEEGVFVNPVITPAVPPDRAMIRTSYMATHTRDHLDRALEAIAKVGRELGVIQ
ncbi:MAG TPA: aminotransferase class I/II-fold pyridoxal phosphate-dependent enzyme [Thermoanaerobaculales bacterium]|nr:aminotransferase class I/II-fold pyridoxal phosphate-dependent enzyme [Thermoanaerobaculales bacterium]HQN94939.1 aminotransferase class I/II-fold pyridoxal phosphate-dependent enzyme [Thermoanaerobaculales bacterium]HQP43150.1 aminotransferase class I/II-fold pyridoxal phosphate-dependent enzyme [Thermoanaerobaculales bacterium]